MGRSRCCVGGCSNVPGNGISLHTFPKEEKLRKQWIRSIQMTGSECSRAGWQGPSKNGSANAQLVCSEHFELTMFTMTTRTKWSLGLAYRTALIDEAIPTLFGDKVRKSNLDQVQARPVVRKREVRRGDMTANPPSTEFPVDAAELDMDMELDNSKRTVMQASCACPKCCVRTAVRGTQVNRRPPPIKRKTKGTETLMEHHITYSTSSTQYCDSDIADEKSLTPACPEVPPAPHLLAFPLPAPVLASTPARKKGRVVVESTLNKSFMSTSSWGYTDDEAIDPDYETEASVYSDSEDDNPRQADVHKQRKFLNCSTDVKCAISLPKAKSAMSRDQLWPSNKFVNVDTPGDGSHSPKLEVFLLGTFFLVLAFCSQDVHLRKCCEFLILLIISLSTFFSHQRTVLWPAIERVWTKCNDQLISVLLDREEELVVAGDGRSDSPGHSAKFGVYSMIDMHTGRVVAIELVQ
ncbi:LOW QUALITY PROTEIN: hypothetical protein MAR_013190, partial [Mya arenaria]